MANSLSIGAVVSGTALILLLLRITDVAGAATWLVRKDGLGHATVIQEAVDMAAPGDTVLVSPGRYLEYAPYDYGALTGDTYVIVTIPNLTIRGTDRDSVIIGEPTNTWPGITQPIGISNIESATNLRIENLTVESMVQGVVFNGSGTLFGCVLRRNKNGLTCWSDTPSVCTTSFFDHQLRFAIFAVRSDGFKVTHSEFSGTKSDVIVSKSQDAVVEYCSFRDSAFVNLEQFSSGLVRNCVIDPIGFISIQDSDALIEHNVTRASPGINLQISGGNVTARYNIFAGGDDVTVFVHGYSNSYLENNHIIKGASEAVILHFFGATGYIADFRNNWWGTTDSAAIAESIIDGSDDPYRTGIVKFWPVLDTPVPVTGRSISSLKALFRQKR